MKPITLTHVLENPILDKEYDWRNNSP